jgi:hypothetical protein
MNRERNQKSKRALLGRLGLALLVAAGGGLVWGGAAQAAARAQAGAATQSSTATQSGTTTPSAAPTQTDTAAAVTPAAASTVDSSLAIPVSGTVTAADGTKIAFAGNVAVSSSAVTNVVGIPPFVMLTFDCAGVNATSGSGAARKTYDTAGFQVIKIRPLQPSDAITITVPVNQLGAGVTLASAWQVTANLTFNTSGQLTSGTLSAATAPTTTSAAATTAQ